MSWPISKNSSWTWEAFQSEGETMKYETPEEAWDDFWREIVAPNGKVDLEQLKKDSTGRKGRVVGARLPLKYKDVSISVHRQD